MTLANDNPLDYYARPGQMTDPREYAGLLRGLPAGIPELCKVVQGVLIHVFWAERYGCPLPDERKQEVNLRSAARELARIKELDDRPLTAERPLDRRLVGNCRDFSVMLVAMLRCQGVPARARCGFATYFLPNHYEDHWVCEYWNAADKRWVLVDAQLDSFQQQTLKIAFDPLDVPRDQFIVAGKAWQMCRTGQASPDQFGIFNLHGIWFVRGNVARDFASLNKMELLPWDAWGIVDKGDADVTPEENALLDRVAALTLADNSSFEELRSLYASDDRLRVPSTISSYPGPGKMIVDLDSV